MKTTLLASILSVWVLVGLFTYLNRYTRRRYFTIWTVAWLFYALWLTMLYGLQDTPESPLLLMLKQWCLGVAAVFLLWGSARFLGSRVAERLVALFMGFLFVWSYIGNYHFEPSIHVQAPIFTLMGAASLLTGTCFIRHYRRRGFVGASLLALGFACWGIYIGSYPFLEASEWRDLGLFVSAVLQLFIAVSMIILVLEEARQNKEQALALIRRQQEEKNVLRDRVQSTEERYRNLFDQAGEGIVIVSAFDLRILELNATAERLLGVTRAEAPHHCLSSFCRLGPAVSTAEPSVWIEALCRMHCLSLIGRNGGGTPVEVHGAPVEFAGQPACQFFFRETTERSRLEQQLRQAEKLSALGQMISGIAHELNNPLAVIKGYLELILGHHDLTPQTRADLQKMTHESNRAAKLVRNFLAFAREQPAHREMLNFNALIQRVIDLREFDLKLAGVQIETDLDPDLPGTCGDPDQIQQILLNLINNSIQAMSESQPPHTLRIRTLGQGHDRLQVVIEDSGPGVPPELEAKIFDPFFTTKAVGTGTGLGLSIAHSILSEHRGRIFHQPSSLGGAGFVVEFPVVEPSAEPPPAGADETPSAEPLGPPGPAQVLVVDDERAVAELLCEMLDLLGLSPTLCQSAPHALELLEQRSFDLILSDYRMPVMNGQQFHGKVRERHPDLARRMIFLTGDVVNEETQSFLQATGNPHLPKPFQLNALQQVVTEVLSGKGARQGASG